MDTNLNSAISAFLSNCEDHQLFQLTRFYRDRLEQAIEEGVEGLGLILTRADHFTGWEYQSVTELTEKGKRAAASKLLLDLVMEKGSGARRVLWESFVKICYTLPELSRILKEIREHGDGQFAYMDTERGVSEVPTHLNDSPPASQQASLFCDSPGQLKILGITKTSTAEARRSQSEPPAAAQEVWYLRVQQWSPNLLIPQHCTGELHLEQKHKETLRAQTETLRVNTVLMREKVKVFQLVDRYAELTVISTVRDRRLVEHELLARGREHEEWREKKLWGELEKIQTDQLFQRNYSYSFWGQIKSLFSRPTTGSSAAVAGVPGIGKTTMVQKIVYDWATGKIYQHFQFVFSFKFRDLNSFNCRINLRELILDQYPYFGNMLREIWKNPEGLLFIFDGLDEYKHRIDFADSRRDTEPQHMCPDPEWWCEVSDIVYSLIQHKLLPGCSVLVTTRPIALHLLEKAEISVWAEILGFVGEERKEYFRRFFEDQTVAAAVFKHVEENEILYTMTYNPSYCWILGLALGPFFTQRHRDPKRVPKTNTQLYSHYIYNILKNHGREIESPCDVLLRVGQMAFTGVSKKKIVFTDGDLIKYNLQPSQFLSGFLMELLEREDCARSVVYTFPHLTIQEFVAALAQFLTPDPGNILKLLSEAHSTTDGRFEIFLRFVAGLSYPPRGLGEFLGPFLHQTICHVIEWVKVEFERQLGNTFSEAGRRSLLKTLYYLFETQNQRLAQTTLESVETLSLNRLRLTPIDCAVLSHVIGLCDTITHLDLDCCSIRCEGLQRLGPRLHKCRELGLAQNDLRDSEVKLVSAALRDPECKIQKLWLKWNCLSDSATADLTSALRTNRSLTELDLSGNKLGDCGVKLVADALRDPACEIQTLRLREISLTDTGAKVLASALSTNCSLMELDLSCNNLRDSGVKLVSGALRDPECKIQTLWLAWNNLTDSGAEDLVSALCLNHSLIELNLGSNTLTDRSVPALRRLIITLLSLEMIQLWGNRFSLDGRNQLKSLQGTRPRLTVEPGVAKCTDIPTRGCETILPALQFKSALQL